MIGNEEEGIKHEEKRANDKDYDFGTFLNFLFCRFFNSEGNFLYRFNLFFVTAQALKK